jgi:N-acetylglucosaminyl-diphospho-decaprenol L-rhamnosyltransferase
MAAALAAPVRAVVVNYNAAEHLLACVAGLLAAGAEVVVVDNGSTDSSRAALAAAHPGVRWIDAGRNLGYGGAANVGAAASDADVLVCNPDLTVDPGAVRALTRRLAEEPDLGVVGPLVHNPDGTVYPSARTFPDLVDAMGHGLIGLVAPQNRFTRRYRLLDWDHRDRRSVDWVSGACMLVRRRAWEEVGGFDTAYFMYLEDVDLCWRIGQAGWRVAFEPGAEVTHVQGASTRLHPYRMLAVHHLSMWRFAWRTTRGARRALLPVVAIGLIGRFGVACGRHRAGGQRAVVPASDRP